MADIVSKETRSRMMSGIRGKNTKPELLLRKGLFSRGFRFRLHVSDLPGRPDVVLPKWQACVFVHGCFWHGHHCRYFRLPSTNSAFWETKIRGNRARDRNQRRVLAARGWRVFVVYECAFRGKNEAERDRTLDALAEKISAPSARTSA